MDTGLPAATIEYLRTRFSGLIEREQLVSILCDEIYTAKRIEYQNGKFYGYENGEVTKTLMCFMLNSVAGSYEDVVAMVPLSKINADIIQKWWSRVVEVVADIGFDIVAT